MANGKIEQYDLIVKEALTTWDALNVKIEKTINMLSLLTDEQIQLINTQQKLYKSDSDLLEQQKKIEKIELENQKLRKSLMTDTDKQIQQEQRLINITNDQNAGTKQRIDAEMKLLKIRKDRLIVEKDNEKELEKIKQRENELSKQLSQFKNDNEKRISGIGKYKEAVTSAFMKIAVAVGLGTAAFKLFEKVIGSTKGTLDTFTFWISGIKEGVNSFFKMLATGDFTNFLSNINNAIRAGKEYAEVLDELQESNKAIRVLQSEMNIQNALDTRIYRDASKSRQERVNAINRIIKREEDFADVKSKLVAKELENDLKLAQTTTKLTRQEIIDYVSKFNEQEKLRESAKKYGETLKTLEKINKGSEKGRQFLGADIAKLRTEMKNTDPQIVLYYTRMSKMDLLNSDTGVSFEKLVNSISNANDVTVLAIDRTQRMAAKKSTLLLAIDKETEKQKKLTEAVLKYNKALEDNELTSFKIEFSKAAKSETDKTTQYLNNKMDEFAKQDIKRTEDTEKAKQELKKLTYEQSRELLLNSSDLALTLYDRELSTLEDNKNKELSNTKLTAKEKEKIEKEYAKKEAEIRRKQAIIQKATDLASVAQNTAVGISKAVPNPILMALVAATGVIQASAILAQPLPEVPQFAKGVKNFEGGQAIVGEKGHELLESNGKFFLTENRAMLTELPKGANVYPNNPLIDLIAETVHEGRKISNTPDNAAILIMADAIRNQKNINVNIDEKGFHTWVKSKNLRSNYITNKYRA